MLNFKNQSSYNAYDAVILLFGLTYNILLINYFNSKLIVLSNTKTPLLITFFISKSVLPINGYFLCTI